MKGAMAILVLFFIPLRVYAGDGAEKATGSSSLKRVIEYRNQKLAEHREQWLDAFLAVDTQGKKAFSLNPLIESSLSFLDSQEGSHLPIWLGFKIRIKNKDPVFTVELRW